MDPPSTEALLKALELLYALSALNKITSVLSAFSRKKEMVYQNVQSFLFFKQVRVYWAIRTTLFVSYS
jgi:hypothetical protein